MTSIFYDCNYDIQLNLVAKGPMFKRTQKIKKNYFLNKIKSFLCYVDSIQKEVVAEGFSSFCKVWNNIRHTLLLFHGKGEEMLSLLRRDLKEDNASVRIVLPDTRGVGACSGILLEYLIGKQNDFVRACRSRIHQR